MQTSHDRIDPRRARRLRRELGRRLRRGAQLGSKLLPRRFHLFYSGDYWERRYRRGGSSGCGSMGALAHFKADTLNAFVEEHGIESVIEFGCGDGLQLALARYPRYLGLDVSTSALARCETLFAGDPSRTFALYVPAEYEALPERQHLDLALSLDVIYHLVEDEVFESHMAHLFGSTRRFVIVYASNYDENVRARHIRHRKFTDWIQRNRPEWRRVELRPDRLPERERAGGHSPASFFAFERVEGA